MFIRTTYVDVTPSFSLPLSGYSSRICDSTGIDDHIEANFLIFEDGSRNITIIGSVDTLFVSRQITEKIERKLGLRPGHLLLIASHTHNAPSLSPETPELGQINNIYVAEIIERITNAIRCSLAGPGRRVKLAPGAGKFKGNCSRRCPAYVLDYAMLYKKGRLKISRRVAMASNRSGPADSTIKIFNFIDDEERVIGVVWSYAAHPAFYPSTDRISADFPGVVRSALRELYGADCAVLYLTGFGGSTIPKIPMRIPRNSIEWATTLLPFFPKLPLFTKRSFSKWSSELAKAVTAIPIGKRHALLSLSLTSEHVNIGQNPNEIPIEVALIDFGSKDMILAVSGEPVEDWRGLVHIPPGTIETGTLSGRPTYIPTQKYIQEGGYEADGFMPAFSLKGNFAPNIDERLGSALTRLLEVR